MDKEVSMDVLIRSEKPSDIEAIEQVTIAAFNGKWYSDQTEHLVVSRLRDAEALSVSLVAEIDGKVVGHVAFSAVTINGEDKGWYGLGPVSVLPEIQKQGIGSKLIHEGLSIIKKKGAKGCVLEGDPNYYQRFGFKNHPVLFYEGTPDPKYFMALPFYEDVPEGKVEFHQAFYGNVK
jgi:putative acetyltransferase